MAETRKFNLYENCFIIPTLLIYPEKSARQKKKKEGKRKRKRKISPPNYQIFKSRNSSTIDDLNRLRTIKLFKTRREKEEKKRREEKKKEGGRRRRVPRYRPKRSPSGTLECSLRKLRRALRSSLESLEAAHQHNRTSSSTCSTIFRKFQASRGQREQFQILIRRVRFRVKRGNETKRQREEKERTHVFTARFTKLCASDTHGRRLRRDRNDEEKKRGHVHCALASSRNLTKISPLNEWKSRFRLYWKIV